MAANLRRIGQQYVLRLQVTVYNAFLMKIMETSYDLSDDDAGIKLMNVVLMPINESP